MTDDPLVRRLKFRDVRILVAVAQTGSMAKAAALLAISQPAMSRTIAQMEQTLSVPLLERTPQGAKPTLYGEALIKRGVVVFDELAQGVKEIQFLKDPSVGELRIASTMGLSEGIVLAVTERLARRYPKLVIHIGSAGLLEQIDALRERRVDLGIAGATAAASTDEINTEVLFVEPLVVVAGDRSPWARRRKIDLADLVHEQWTWPAVDTVINTLVVGSFRAKGLQPPSAAIYTNNTNIRIRLAMTGRYLAVVPESFMSMTPKPLGLKILPVELPKTERQIGILTLSNRLLSPQARLFIECARDLAKSRGPFGKEAVD